MDATQAEEEARKAKEAEEIAKREAETVPQVLRCPECGIELRPDARFCNKCGARISGIEKQEKPTVSTGMTETAETSQKVSRCPQCGIELRPDACFCNKCGARVGKNEKRE